MNNPYMINNPRQ